jgi:hypothetical protein
MLLALAVWTRPCGADSPEDFAARVDRLIRERQPTAAEKRFDDIGWTRDIRSALRAAKTEGRPTFLFTHDGHMAIGRC